MDDITLLREYAARNSEAAFATLVSRRIDFVYSSALRQVRDPQTAQEITQAVFIILAQKAGRITNQTNLSGWLFKTTRFVAMAEIRDAVKRREREREAHMQSEIQSTAPDALWEQMSPLLDEALSQLADKDRQALLLRFFDNQSLAQVGSSLGTGEDTARKRVARALEKLRRYFSKRGVVSTTAVIVGALSANSVHAAPSVLAASISAVAVTKGAVAGTSTLTLVKGALKLMAWAHAKTAIVVGVSVLIVAGTTTVLVEKVSALTESSADGADPKWADDPENWASDSRVLETLPPAMIIRPTRFPKTGGGVASDNRLVRKNASVNDLLQMAYAFKPTRIVFLQDMPPEHYDLIYSLPEDFSTVLPKEIARRFGYTAHKETREADVLLLKFVSTNAPNLKLIQNQKGSSSSSTGDKITMNNQGMDMVATDIEQIMGQPVLDRTGMKDKYDFTFLTPWKRSRPSKDTLNQALLEQLGLEVVPAREPVEMLIIEKVK